MKRFHVHVSVDDLDASIQILLNGVRRRADGGQARLCEMDGG